jgi:hypothetical protein
VVNKVRGVRSSDVGAAVVSVPAVELRPAEFQNSTHYYSESDLDPDISDKVSRTDGNETTHRHRQSSIIQPSVRKT